MSVRIMSRAWEVRLADSEKIVLLALADWSDDDGNCWPSLPQLARKCSKGERIVQHAIKALELAGHIERKVIVGKGTRYRIHPRNNDTPAAAAPRSDDTPAAIAPTPAAAAPNTSSTRHKTSEAKASSVSRAKRDRSLNHPLPANFEPVLTPQALETIEQWPPGMFEREMAKWRNHHASKGTLAKDWQASLRNWLIRADEYRTERNGHASRSSSQPRIDGFTSALREMGDFDGFADRRN